MAESKSSRTQRYSCRAAGLNWQQGLIVAPQVRLTCSSRLRPVLSLKKWFKVGLLLSTFCTVPFSWSQVNNGEEVTTPPCRATLSSNSVSGSPFLSCDTITSQQRQWLASQSLPPPQYPLSSPSSCICLQASLQSRQGNIKLSTQQSWRKHIFRSLEQHRLLANQYQLVAFFLLMRKDTLLNTLLSQVYHYLYSMFGIHVL